MKMISRGFGFFIVITLLTEAQEDKSVSFGLVHNFLNFLTKYLLEKNENCAVTNCVFWFHTASFNVSDS